MEYIDKKALRNALFNGEHNLYSWEEIEAKIDAILADDVAPVRRGKWEDGYSVVFCSVCGEQSEWRTPYCPMCGAKME